MVVRGGMVFVVLLSSLLSIAAAASAGGRYGSCPNSANIGQCASLMQTLANTTEENANQERYLQLLNATTDRCECFNYCNGILINCRTNFLGTLHCTGEEGRPYVAGCMEADLLEGMTLVQPANESTGESTNETLAGSYDDSITQAFMDPTAALVENISAPTHKSLADGVLVNEATKELAIETQHLLKAKKLTRTSANEASNNVASYSNADAFSSRADDSSSILDKESKLLPPEDKLFAEEDDAPKLSYANETTDLPIAVGHQQTHRRLRA